MNRQTKRTIDHRDRADGNGSLGLGEMIETAPRQERAPRSRTTPMKFAREIRHELRQVAWPDRFEMINYSTVVFVTLVIMIALIFVLNYAFGKGVIFMFQK